MYLGIIFGLLSLYFTSINALPTLKNDEYDAYQACPPIIPSMLNVHMVAHSHDDVGWLKTVDEYFYGDKNYIQPAGVQYILDTVIDELEKNPERRFIYAEMSFFWRWWISRGDEDHQRMINLVKSGQMEFVGGGWSQADEATVYYAEFIDEMTRGLRFLNDTFGPMAVPKVAWQIDPFGHSRELAFLLHQMGFDGVFFSRLDVEDRIRRLNHSEMEMIWDTSDNIENANLFTGALYVAYGAPWFFCFDITWCEDPPMQDNPELKDYNIDIKVNDFIRLMRFHALFYATNNIMITMGGDFQYQDARTNFINMDKLVKYVNERQTTNGSNVNVFYSTPSCYLKALIESGHNWTTKSDDFLPYASDIHAYWSGFYTSRPALKGFSKYTNNFLQIAKQLTTFGNVGTANEENLDTLKRYQGDMQHHDAVTGTEKQAVAFDYAESLSIGLTTATAAINSAFASITPLGSSYPPAVQYCPYLNVSYCDLTEQQQSFTLIVYNPQAHNVQSQVRVPVTGSTYTVSGPDGSPIASQIAPVPQPVLDDPERKGTAQTDLVFHVDLPPTGYQTYFVESTDASEKSSQPSTLISEMPNADFVIQNEFLSVTVDSTTGLLKSVTDLVNGKTYNVEQNYYYYQGWAGDNLTFDRRSSGAYIFRPNGTSILISPTATVTTYTGTEVQEIHQTFSDYISQVIRLYPGENKVEIEWMVGPIPVDDEIGKEIITLYSTDIQNNEVFYTDANGRQILQRVLNYRPSWNLSLHENISGNYFPINSRIYIQDEFEDSQLTIMTDRTEGGSSLEGGNVEIMLHRRLLYDEDKGVGEALNEPGVDGKGLRVRGKHWLIFSSIEEAAPLHRVAGMAIANPPLVFIAPLIDTVPNYISKFKTTYTGLTSPLPDNVNLLTVEPWRDETVLLRFEHFYEKVDDPNGLSQSVTFNIQDLFTDFKVVEIRETTLGANVWLNEETDLLWKYQNPDQEHFVCQEYAESLNITLTPMQIRTFVTKVQYY